MTMEQLNNAVTDAQRELAVVTAKRTELDAESNKLRERINELSAEESAVRRAYYDMGGEVVDARMGVYRAERAVNRARNNAIIAEHGRMSKKAFLESVREEVRSKNLEIAKSLVLTLERAVGYEGATAVSLTMWREQVDEDYSRERNLSQAQIRRVHKLLNIVCPKTAQGNYLPPYTVQDAA